jgi:large subunit ribosomal protein L25
LKAIKRENTTSGQINKLRSEGLIPAILYGGKNPNTKISIEKKSVKNFLNAESFLSTVVELDIEGEKQKALPREVAYHVVSDEPIHIDFMRIVPGSKIIIELPVQFKNHSESPGLKRGGVLNIVRRKVELKCPAERIPDDIVIDLAGLDIGTSIKISTVKLPENVVPTISDRDFVIATVAAPTVIKEPEKPAEVTEGAEGAEGQVAAEGAEGAAPKEGEAAKKDEKGKEAAGDKKQAAGDKKQAEKK